MNCCCSEGRGGTGPGVLDRGLVGVEIGDKQPSAPVTMDKREFSAAVELELVVPRSLGVRAGGKGETAPVSTALLVTTGECGDTHPCSEEEEEEGCKEPEPGPR